MSGQIIIGVVIELINFWCGAGKMKCAHCIYLPRREKRLFDWFLNAATWYTLTLGAIKKYVVLTSIYNLASITAADDRVRRD